MSAHTITTRSFKCDHCGDSKTFNSDAGAAMDGWAIVAVNSGQYALCRVDAGRLRAFLRGDGAKADF